MTNVKNYPMIFSYDPVSLLTKDSRPHLTDLLVVVVLVLLVAVVLLVAMVWSIYMIELI